jgi:hypothetical protein
MDRQNIYRRVAIKSLWPEAFVQMESCLLGVSHMARVFLKFYVQIFSGIDRQDRWAYCLPTGSPEV